MFAHVKKKERKKEILNKIKLMLSFFAGVVNFLRINAITSETRFLNFIITKLLLKIIN